MSNTLTQLKKAKSAGIRGKGKKRLQADPINSAPVDSTPINSAPLPQTSTQEISEQSVEDSSVRGEESGPVNGHPRKKKQRLGPKKQLIEAKERPVLAEISSNLSDNSRLPRRAKANRVEYIRR